MHVRTSRLFRRPGLLALLPAVVMMALFCGCSPKTGTSDKVRSVVPASVMHLFVGVDVSGSTGSDKETRKHYCGQIKDVIKRALPRENSDVTIWFYDISAWRKFGPSIVQEDKDLFPTYQAIQEYASDRQGTLQSAILSKMLEEAKKAEQHGERAACLLLSDGEFEPGDTKAIAEKTKALSALKGVKAVWLCGAQAEVRGAAGVGGRYHLMEKMESALSPLGMKGHVSSEGADAKSGFDWFSKRLEEP